jgi:hypothetical protein
MKRPTVFLVSKDRAVGESISQDTNKSGTLKLHIENNHEKRVFKEAHQRCA